MFHNHWQEHDMLDLNLTMRWLSITISLMVIYLTGMMDDLVGVRYRAKFAVQIVCVLLITSSGLYFDNFYGLFGIHEIPAYVGIPLTVLIFCYILNAINLIDGIDGLASGLSMIAFFAFSCMFIRLHWWMYAFISVASFAVLIPFFYYNVFGKPRRGRKIFMGDTGSLTIGLLLAVCTIRLSMADPVKDSLLPSAIIIAFSFLLVPLLDVVRVVFCRLRRGKNPFEPDRNHIHHRLMAMGMSQRKALVCIVFVALAFVVFNMVLIYQISPTGMLVIDVALYGLMHVCIAARIRQRQSAGESGRSLCSAISSLFRAKISELTQKI
ncbi:MAG: undecaprenyl/decaprenyl-phosphate alpha-N-acetylglucosaminyl 1-phosphate transferase [Mediterranea sp.]|nr:undecaprenyl/decaprenyl-phosphate alpha-N-acetylglucosaminyl 1-phosphate transferase [Mediterranea sp.]